MPTFRPDLAAIPMYTPGRPVADVQREHGLESVIKLASNECPYEPFPPVVEAVAAAASAVNRYPDNRRQELREAIGDFHGISPGEVWVGGGSNELMYVTALAVGGPGTSAVFADPTFGLYRIATQLAMAEGIGVPLDVDYRHDLKAMADAVRSDTTVVYLCNPNNPTGTHVAAEKVTEFIDAIPDRVLVVVDEAYHEFANAPDFESARRLAIERENVVVAHTFSKAYGLAGLRAGYFIGHPRTLDELKRIQLPFSVGTLAQVAAIEALQHQDLVAERMADNQAGLERVERGLADRGLEFADSQTNFVWVNPPMPAADCAAALQQRGVIVRTVGDAIRISIGTPAENERLLLALDEAI
ncbi:MAG: histidinol-phosphate transaminase [Acidimicrobiia bacterium]